MTYSVICKSNPNLNLGSILIWGRSKNLLVEQNFLKNLIRIPKILVCPVWENVVLTSSGRLSNGAAYLLGATFEIPYFILTEEVAGVIPRLSFQSSNGIPNHLSPLLSLISDSRRRSCRPRLVTSSKSVPWPRATPAPGTATHRVRTPASCCKKKWYFTGLPFRLITSSCWHQNKSSITV